jgi:hypothetical protein
MYYELWFAKESKDEVLAQLSTSSLKIVDVNNKRWVVVEGEGSLVFKFAHDNISIRDCFVVERVEVVDGIYWKRVSWFETGRRV